LPVPMTRPSIFTTGISSAPVVARQVRFGHFQAGGLRQLDHRLPRDAVKRARRQWRREQRAVFHNEQIVAGAFGHETFGVEHDGFFAAAVVRLDLGEDVVEIIQRLDGRVERAVQVARRRHGDDVQPALVIRRRIKLDLVRDDDDGRLFATARIQAKRAHAARDDEADVTFAQLVFPARLDGGLHQFRMRQWNLKQNRFGGVEQPVNMLLELEDAAVVNADAFKNAVAVKQSVVEHGHLGTALVEIFAVNIDFHA